MVVLTQSLTLTMSDQALLVSTTSRGVEGLVAHSPLYSTQNSTQPIGGRVGSPTAMNMARSEVAVLPSDAVRSAALDPVETAKVAVKPMASAQVMRSVCLKPQSIV